MTKFTYGSRRARKLAGLTTKKPKSAKPKVSQVLKSMSNAQIRNIKGILKRPARQSTKARRKKTAPRVKWADRVMQGKIPMGEIQFNEIIPHLKIAADPVLPPEPKLDTPRIEAMFEEI